MTHSPSSPPASAPSPLKAATSTITPRCPVKLWCDRFPDAELVRCVLRDDHLGCCMLIDGKPLTEAQHAPDARYRLMGLPVPDRITHWATGGAAATTRPALPPWRYGQATIAVFVVVMAAWVVSMAVFGAKALGWIH